MFINYSLYYGLANRITNGQTGQNSNISSILRCKSDKFLYNGRSKRKLGNGWSEGWHHNQGPSLPLICHTVAVVVLASWSWERRRNFRLTPFANRLWQWSCHHPLGKEFNFDYFPLEFKTRYYYVSTSEGTISSSTSFINRCMISRRLRVQGLVCPTAKTFEEMQRTTEAVVDEDVTVVKAVTIDVLRGNRLRSEFQLNKKNARSSGPDVLFLLWPNPGIRPWTSSSKLFINGSYISESMKDFFHTAEL